MPKDFLFFVAGEAPELITRLISPNPEFRGLAMTRTEAFQNFEKIEDLVGTFFKIMPEGYHLTGRHFGYFLHMKKGIPHTDPKLVEHGVHLMSEAGLEAIKNHRALLNGQWFRNLR